MLFSISFLFLLRTWCCASRRWSQKFKVFAPDDQMSHWSVTGIMHRYAQTNIPRNEENRRDRRTFLGTILHFPGRIQCIAEVISQRDCTVVQRFMPWNFPRFEFDDMIVLHSGLRHRPPSPIKRLVVLYKADNECNYVLTHHNAIDLVVSSKRRVRKYIMRPFLSICSGLS